MYEGLVGSWQGPVVWWQPVLGERHALSPEERPRPGQTRDTVCGLSVTLQAPSDVDWLLPTCDECWAQAVARRDDQVEHQRAQRERERRAQASERARRDADRRWS
ncbi:zinc finger protein [Haloactinomyces albus]|uniref:Zinc-finger n=1 Tax=Haloactinomyces albus TaxID=1352928 RepID=A0AAE4CLI4_9ACTN|nr:zinc finger protein [Haloactinomyces albus]MDR7301869.1 hypothetical protein [Haloactinomyces albus]